MDKKTITLEHPIKLIKDGIDVECKEITIGRLKTKHLKLLPKGFAKRAAENDIDPIDLIPLISGMSGLTEEYVDELDIDDLFKIVEELEDFLGTSRTTGKK